MKIIILHRKLLFSILLLCLLFSSLLFYFTMPNSFALELTTNSVMDTSLREKITTLTKKEEKIAYLTFDDGPTLKATEKILDILYYCQYQNVQFG